MNTASNAGRAALAQSMLATRIRLGPRGDDEVGPSRKKPGTTTKKKAAFFVKNAQRVKAGEHRVRTSLGLDDAIIERAIVAATRPAPATRAGAAVDDGVGVTEPKRAKVKSGTKAKTKTKSKTKARAVPAIMPAPDASARRERQRPLTAEQRAARLKAISDDPLAFEDEVRILSRRVVACNGHIAERCMVMSAILVASGSLVSDAVDTLRAVGGDLAGSFAVFADETNYRDVAGLVRALRAVAGVQVALPSEQQFAATLRYGEALQGAMIRSVSQYINTFTRDAPTGIPVSSDIDIKRLATAVDDVVLSGEGHADDALQPREGDYDGGVCGAERYLQPVVPAGILSRLERGLPAWLQTDTPTPAIQSEPTDDCGEVGASEQDKELAVAAYDAVMHAVSSQLAECDRYMAEGAQLHEELKRVYEDVYLASMIPVNLSQRFTSFVG
jgi:hypothetical protein